MYTKSSDNIKVIYVIEKEKSLYIYKYKEI